MTLVSDFLGKYFRHSPSEFPFHTPVQIKTGRTQYGNEDIIFALPIPMGKFEYNLITIGPLFPDIQILMPTPVISSAQLSDLTWLTQLVLLQPVNQPYTGYRIDDMQIIRENSQINFS